jgi:hypothetical protein
LGQWRRRAEKDYNVGRWSRAESEHDHLEQWQFAQPNDHDDHYI